MSDVATPVSVDSPSDISVISQSPENTNSATYDIIQMPGEQECPSHIDPVKEETEHDDEDESIRNVVVHIVLMCDPNFLSDVPVGRGLEFFCLTPLGKRLFLVFAQNKDTWNRRRKSDIPHL